MDKQEAIKRLDALDNEARKLRKIIEQADKLVYDEEKIYIGIKDGEPYVMTGRGPSPGSAFCFQSFDEGEKSLIRWDNNKATGQECLDYHLSDGFDIRAFDSTREAFQFFLDNLRE
jgi:hypothetical protein